MIITHVILVMVIMDAWPGRWGGHTGAGGCRGGPARDVCVRLPERVARARRIPVAIVRVCEAGVVLAVLRHRAVNEPRLGAGAAQLLEREGGLDRLHGETGLLFFFSNLLKW